MIALATVSDMERVGVVLDVERGVVRELPAQPAFHDHTVVGRPPCRPFGITWNADELFIANNRQLLVFDRALDYVRTAATPLQINTHQLAYRAPYVWAASPWTNSLIAVPTGAGPAPLEFDIFRQQVRPYVERSGAAADDANHVNSLLWADGSLYVAAHNLGRPSFILVFDAAELRLTGMIADAGFAIHGLARHDGELFWISTKSGEIRSDRGYRLALPQAGFARGFAFDGEHFVVATSERRDRLDRSGGDGWIHVLDRHGGAVLAAWRLKDSGGINDLRLLDTVDYAHGASAPFLDAAPVPGFSLDH